VAITTVISILWSQLIVYLLYGFMGVGVRRSEVILCVVAPLVIASIISWYLYGLIKKLEMLEGQLKNSITKEREEIYLATIHGAQHITNNLLHGLFLIAIEIDKHPEFDIKRKDQFNDLIKESKKLMGNLSSVDEICPDKIRSSVAPHIKAENG